MADNCALYISKNNLDIVSFFAENDTGARVNFIASEKGEWGSIELIWRDLKITINRMSRDDTRFPAQVEGLSNYLFYLSEQVVTPRVFALLERLQRTAHVFGLVIEPGFDKEERWKSTILKIADYLKALIFVNDALYDSKMHLLLGEVGRFDKEAVIPYFDSAIIRKVKIEEILRTNYFDEMITQLPPVISEEEVNLRLPPDIAARAVILSFTAGRANGVGRDIIIKSLDRYQLRKYLTQKEKLFLEAKELANEELQIYRWDYEAVQILLWALGYDNIPYFPDKKCNHHELINYLNKSELNEFISKAEVRPAREILDKLDLVYRLHALIKNEPSYTGKLIPEVVYKWHYTLNWITRYMNREWDNVPTNS